MPAPGQAWRHVVISTLGSWLPGDPRGWRSRGHKRHSSGDYKNPPPAGEYALLHRYNERLSAKRIVIPRKARADVGRAIVALLCSEGHRLLVMSVGGMHAHLLVELPDNVRRIKAIVGHAKSKSSRAVKHILPGSIWARGGRFEKIKDRAHHRNVYNYILTRQERGTWVWSYKDRPRCM